LAPRLPAKRRACVAMRLLVLRPLLGAALGVAAGEPAPGSNPLFRDRFTADPAPLVVGDRLYLYVGHDQARGEARSSMAEWVVCSTSDLKQWTAHGPVMKFSDFKWAKAAAWASQAIATDGRFWFYTAVEHDDTHPGKAIGVAVSH